MVKSYMKARETLIGTSLGGKVDRTVPIEAEAGPRTATLRKRAGSGRARFSFFEVEAVEDVGDPAARGCWSRSRRSSPAR